MSIFTDMVERSLEVFMDDFSVFGNSFGDCLTNLEQVQQRLKGLEAFWDMEVFIGGSLKIS